jgi:hypothetical protein
MVDCLDDRHLESICAREMEIVRPTVNQTVGGDLVARFSFVDGAPDPPDTIKNYVRGENVLNAR